VSSAVDAVADSPPLDGRSYCSDSADDGNGGNKNDKHNHEDVLRRLIMRDLRLLPHCTWGFLSSGLLRGIDR
jgi:hypothetical protein